MSADLAHAPADKAAMSFGPTLRLQRKCACGGTCDSCKKKKGLQAKLEVGASDDRFEREADRAADQVMNGVRADATTAAPLQLQRVSGGVSGLGEAPHEVQEVLGQSGSAIDAGARAFFESRFGHDFSRVRVHHDVQADASARAVGARAYTVGSQVVFANGQYAPHSQAGRTLLAHELAHVVQQGQGGTLLQRAPGPAEPCAAKDTHQLELKPEFKQRVLSDAELAKGPRAAAMRQISETTARMFATKSQKEKKSPQALSAGTEVTVTKVWRQPTVCKANGELYSTGSGYFEISLPTGKTGYAFSAVLGPVDEVKPAQKPPQQSKAVPEIFKIDKSRMCVVPDKLALQKPPNFKLIGEQAEKDLAAGNTNLDPEVQRILQGLKNPADRKMAERLIGKRSAPLKFAVLLPPGLEDDVRKRGWVAGNHSLWGDPQVSSLKIDLFRFNGQDDYALAEPYSDYNNLFYSLVNAAVRIRKLKRYFEPSIEGKALEPAGDDGARRITRVDEMLDGLSKEARKRFDDKALAQMTDWESFESLLSDHVQREAVVKRLMDSKAETLSGEKLDALNRDQAGGAAENDKVQGKLDELKSEKKRRDDYTGEQRGKANERAEAMRKTGFLAADPNVQVNMLGEVFGRGFLAGAHYETPRDAWSKAGTAIEADPATFGVGIAGGLVPGALDGIYEALKGLIDMLVMAGGFGMKAIAYQVKEIYEPWLSPEEYVKRKQGENAVLKEFISTFADGAKQFAQQFRDDPAFLSGPAFDIGMAVGRNSGKWLNANFLDPSVSVVGKGYVVGEILGRVIIEIAMAVVAPEQLGARTAAMGGTRVGTALIKAMEEIVEKIPALKKLLEARKVAKAAPDAPKLPGAGRADTPLPKADAPKPKVDEAPKPKDAKADEAPKAKDTKADETAQAGADAEKALAREPLGGGHHLEANQRGVCLCSDPPCPNFVKSLGKPLQKRPNSAKRLEAADKLSVKNPKNPKKAVKDAKAAYQDFEKTDPLEKWRARYRRDPGKLMEVYARELTDSTGLTEMAKRAERSYQRDGFIDSEELDELLKQLHEARAAKAKGKGTGRKVDPYLDDVAEAEKRLAKEMPSAKDAAAQQLAARKKLAQQTEQRLPKGSKVKVVSTERTAAGRAQGAAASRDTNLADPDFEYAIDLPNDVRMKAELPLRPDSPEGKAALDAENAHRKANSQAPMKKPGSGSGLFKPDDIQFDPDGKRYLFLDHKEVEAAWSGSFYGSESGEEALERMLQRHLNIVNALGADCKGMAYTTNESKLADLIAKLIAKNPYAKGKLFAPGYKP